MPHITVKLFPGRTEDQKHAFTDAVVQLAIETLGSKLESLSVAFEDIPQADWKSRVVEPEISKQKLYKKPGYPI